jgi:hypothetical protein
MLIKRASVLGLTLLLFGAIAMPSANAISSVGFSSNCDSDGHCVTGTAMSSNAAIQVSSERLSAGKAVAICKGNGTGAVIIEITCSIGSNSQTMSFPGSAGAVPIETNTNQLGRLPVCWDVTGFFPVITGPEHQVPTSGCAIVGV